jgi:hypothetical protein
MLTESPTRLDKRECSTGSRKNNRKQSMKKIREDPISLVEVKI